MALCFFMYLCMNLSIDRSIYLSFYPSIHQSMSLSTQQAVSLSICRAINYQAINLSSCQSTSLSLYHCINVSRSTTSYTTPPLHIQISLYVRTHILIAEHDGDVDQQILQPIHCQILLNAFKQGSDTFPDLVGSLCSIVGQVSCRGHQPLQKQTGKANKAPNGSWRSRMIHLWRQPKKGPRFEKPQELRARDAGKEDKDLSSVNSKHKKNSDMIMCHHLVVLALSLSLSRPSKEAGFHLDSKTKAAQLYSRTFCGGFGERDLPFRSPFNLSH